MNQYIKKISKIPDFQQNGFFKGYYLINRNSGIEVDYIDMMTGHQYYQKETESIHIFYIIKGKGLADINHKVYPIESGDIVEIPINTEYAFKGNLQMIEIMNPPFNLKTHIETRKNNVTERLEFNNEIDGEKNESSSRKK